MPCECSSPVFDLPNSIFGEECIIRSSSHIQKELCFTLLHIHHIKNVLKTSVKLNSTSINLVLYKSAYDERFPKINCRKLFLNPLKPKLA